MEQQRPFLYLSLFFLCFLIWSTWQQRNAPIAPTNTSTTSTTEIPSSSSYRLAIDCALRLLTQLEARLVQLQYRKQIPQQQASAKLSPH